jgi:hypothetical protein
MKQSIVKYVDEYQIYISMKAKGGGDLRGTRRSATLGNPKVVESCNPKACKIIDNLDERVTRVT